MFEELAKYYYNQGLTLARATKPSQAVSSLQQAVFYDQTNYLAWNLLGLCYYRLGSYQMSRFAWQQSLAQNSQTNPAREYLEKLTAAIIKTEPVFKQVTELLQMKKYHQASQLWQEKFLPEFDPATASLNYLGVLQSLAGKKKAARQTWQAVLQIEQENQTACHYLQASKLNPLIKWLHRSIGTDERWFKQP